MKHNELTQGVGYYVLLTLAAHGIFELITDLNPADYITVVLVFGILLVLDYFEAEICRLQNKLQSYGKKIFTKLAELNAKIP